MSHHAAKPCGPVVVHPWAVTNQPGRDRIAYRVGDFATFRDALLRPLGGETDLGPLWRPGPDDLGLQLVEWWAYLAAVLTFYGEEWMQGSYLRTAKQDLHVRRLVRLLGYRPRPAIAATGRLAADVTAPVPLPKGFAFQSKPGPGEEPQVFELDAATKLAPPSAVAALPDTVGPLTADGQTVWVRGAVSGVNAGDRLLVLNREWDGDDRYRWAVVDAVEPDKDVFGKPATRVRFAAKLELEGTAADFQLLRSTQSSQIWPHGVTGHPATKAKELHLGALVRDLRPGDLFLYDATRGFLKTIQDFYHEWDIDIAHPFISFGGTESVEPLAKFVVTGGKYKQHSLVVGGTDKLTVGLDSFIDVSAHPLFEFDQPPPPTTLQRVTEAREDVWFANGAAGNPTLPPADEKVPGIPLPHTVLSFLPGLGGAYWDEFRYQIDVRHGWRDVGELMPAPVRSFDGTDGILRAVGPVGFPAEFNGPVLIEGADGKGSPATLSVASESKASATELPVPAEPLSTPLNVWTTLLPVSRGQTVEREVLGSGDARVLGQEFVLQKKPLTYLPKADPDVGRLYTSTLRVWVDGVRWKEVSHFHGQPDDARVYVTHEDDAGKTHVRFATRLPTGAGNVVAAYRHGGGAADPAAGTLTMILKPRDGLRAVRNPVKVGGGADPEPAGQMRRYAPRSVLTFDRAVSADDYEAIAAQAPGVTRARAYWRFVPSAQRGGVVVYVGDDTEAVTSAGAALRDAQDPNRPATVLPAVPVPVRLELSVQVSPDRVAADVLDALRAALLDPDLGLFGTQSGRIGRALFDSELSAACLAVPGVRAVRLLRFAPVGSADPFPFAAAPPTVAGLPPCAGHRHAPGEGNFFTLATENLQLGEETGHAA